MLGRTPPRSPGSAQLRACAQSSKIPSRRAFSFLESVDGGDERFCTPVASSNSGDAVRSATQRQSKNGNVELNPFSALPLLAAKMIRPSRPCRTSVFDCSIHSSADHAGQARHVEENAAHTCLRHLPRFLFDQFTLLNRTRGNAWSNSRLHCFPLADFPFLVAVDDSPPSEHASARHAGKEKPAAAKGRAGGGTNEKAARRRPSRRANSPAT